MKTYANLVQVGPRTFVDPSKVTLIDYDDENEIFLLGHFGVVLEDEYANKVFLPEWNGTAADLYFVLTGTYQASQAKRFWEVEDDEPNPDSDKHSAFDEE